MAKDRKYYAKQALKTNRKRDRIGKKLLRAKSNLDILERAYRKSSTEKNAAKVNKQTRVVDGLENQLRKANEKNEKAVRDLNNFRG